MSKGEYTDQGTGQSILQGEIKKLLLHKNFSDKILPCWSGECWAGWKWKMKWARLYDCDLLFIGDLFAPAGFCSTTIASVRDALIIIRLIEKSAEEEKRERERHEWLRMSITGTGEKEKADIFGRPCWPVINTNRVSSSSSSGDYNQQHHAQFHLIASVDFFTSV